MSYFSSGVAARGVVTAWDGIIASAAASAGVEAPLIRAVIAAESAWNPTAVSFDNSSMGIMQLNIGAHRLTQEFAFDPSQAIPYGARLLGDQLARRGGDVSLALAAYNAGTSRKDADLRQRIDGNVLGVGNYVETVLQYLAYYREQAGGGGAAAVEPSGFGWGGSLADVLRPTGGTLDAWGEPVAVGGGEDSFGELVATPGPDGPSWGLLGALGAGLAAVLALGFLARS